MYGKEFVWSTRVEIETVYAHCIAKVGKVGRIWTRPTTSPVRLPWIGLLGMLGMLGKAIDIRPTYTAESAKQHTN